jgi:ankyrin repeat protein
MGPKKKVTGRSKSKSPSRKKSPDENVPALPPIEKVVKLSVIQFTVATSDVGSLNRLVEHYNYGDVLHERDPNGSTALHIAVKKGDETMLTQLLFGYPSMKLLINSCEKPFLGGYSPLHIAASLDHANLVTKLASFGANLNLKALSQLGETPLVCAIKAGNKNAAKALIEAGCKLDARDGFGHNASFWASQRGHENLIKELGLPIAKTATADEYVSLLLRKNKNFKLPSVKEKSKKKNDKGGGKKGKKK